MAEFLLELFSEEIPARMQVKAAEDLQTFVATSLKNEGLTFENMSTFSTPRRLTLAVNGLPLQQPDKKIEKKGPRIDAPQQALDGFLKSIGRADFENCDKEETPKGTFWFYRDIVAGNSTERVLQEIVEDFFDAFTWPKSMRWKSGEKTWVRPLHSIISLFDGKLIPIIFNLGGNEKQISSATSTKGHRFLSDGKAFEVSDFTDYKQKLKDHKVLLDRADRKAIIVKQAQELAAKEKLQVREDEGLFEEIVGLVEWPVALVGTFEKEYLDVPQEVLISTMRGNQKYIALLDSNGKLANKFIVIANTETQDGGKEVVAGNEKVLRARLSDAKFYWDQDRRQKLESRLPALEQVTFHQKLGTVRDRVTRLEKLSSAIAKAMGASEADAARAARLAKADLSAGVVFQFPEVQGIIGRYYAMHDGEKTDVANAIADHYKPVGANDSCPTAPVSIAVALADKIDTLVGFFAIDEKPTGSKDPFALRRAALGIIRIILENKLELLLPPLFEEAYKNYGVKGLRLAADVVSDLMQFFTDRLKVAFKDKGARFDIVDAVLSAHANDRLIRIEQRIHALEKFLKTEDGKNLAAAYKRGVNILKIEEKKDGKSYTPDFNTGLLQAPEEKDLATVLQGDKAINDAMALAKFDDTMSAMALLRKPVDAFFEKIMVNVPEKDVRENRLKLLSKIRTVINHVADFSKLEG